MFAGVLMHFNRILMILVLILALKLILTLNLTLILSLTCIVNSRIIGNYLRILSQIMTVICQTVHIG